MTITITSTSAPAITSYDIQPSPYNIQATRDGNRITFKLDRPRKLVISLSGPYRFNNPALFLFAEGPEVNPPKIGDANVKNVLEYGADTTGATEATAKINQAIADMASQPSGGVVFVPRGKYKCATVVMKSKVTLYLEGGAYLLAQGATQGREVRTQSNWSTGTCMVGFDRCVDAHLIGRGTIDFNGGWFGYNLGQCRRTSIEGVILKNDNRWTIHPVNCDSIQIVNVKILNHSLTTGQYSDDAINIDVCRDVLIDDVFAFCVDDFTTSCGTPGVPIAPIENYTVRNCVAANSFRFHLVKSNTEGRYTYIKNLSIENSHHVVNPGEGGPIFRAVDGTTNSGRATYLEGLRIKDCSTSGSFGLGATANTGYTFRDWTVDGFQQLTPMLSQFGNTCQLMSSGGIIEKVSFRCYTINGKVLNSAADCAAAKYMLTNATIAFLPCDASGISMLRAQARQARSAAARLGPFRGFAHGIERAGRNCSMAWRAIRGMYSAIDRTHQHSPAVYDASGRAQ